MNIDTTHFARIVARNYRQFDELYQGDELPGSPDEFGEFVAGLARDALTAIMAGGSAPSMDVNALVRILNIGAYSYGYACARDELRKMSAWQ